MNGALWFLITRSTVGRMRARIGRMKNPKYLLGAAIGLIYFYRMLFRNVARMGPMDNAFDQTAILTTAGGSILMGFLCLQWVTIFRCGGLRLTESELDILFAAPLSRRDLLHYHLLKAQPALLISSAILTLILSRIFPFAGYFGPWLLIFFIFNFFALNQTFLDLLALIPLNIWLNRALQLLIGLILLGSGITAVTQVIPGNAPAVFPYGLSFLVHLAWPFQAVAKALIHAQLSTFASAAAILFIMGGILYLGANLLNVDQVRLEERTLTRHHKRIRRQQRKSGSRQLTSTKAKSRDLIGWFGSGGSVIRVIVGKLLIGAFRHAPRVPLTYMIPGFTLIWCFLLLLPSEDIGVLNFLPLYFSLILMVVGTRLLHLDFRTVLIHLELLRSFPVKGTHMVLAVMIVNGLIIGAAQALMCLLFGISSLFAQSNVLGYSPWAMGLASLLMFPLVAILFFLLENLLILWLPAWFMDEPGEVRARGFDVMGKRILTLVIRMAGFFFLLLIPGILFLTIVLLLQGDFGLMLGSSLFALIIAGELVPITIFAGYLYDRIESFGDDLM